jgi:co-chaperonin GroES (HSP10)
MLLAYESIEDAFPDVAPGVTPFGSRVVCQIRRPMDLTKSGFHLPQETRETEKWNTQVAKVISMGPGAFKDRDTLAAWPEGAWCEVGTFVRVPKYGGDKWEVVNPSSVDKVLFAIFNDVDLIGRIEGDPLEMVAYVG